MTGVWLAMVLAGVGTFAFRGSFLFLFGYVGDVPARAKTVLGMVPPAVLAALVVPAVVAPDGAAVVAGNERLPAGVAAALVAWVTENILATIVTGLVVLVVVQAV